MIVIALEDMTTTRRESSGAAEDSDFAWMSGETLQCGKLFCQRLSIACQRDDMSSWTGEEAFYPRLDRERTPYQLRPVRAAHLGPETQVRARFEVRARPTDTSPLPRQAADPSWHPTVEAAQLEVEWSSENPHELEYRRTGPFALPLLTPLLALPAAVPAACESAAFPARTCR